MSTMSDKHIGTGWRRADGRMGIRNHLLALSTVALTDRLVQLASQHVPGVLPVTPAFSRGLRGADARLQSDVTRKLIAHPNVGAVLVVTHDIKSAAVMAASLAGLGRPWQVLALMACNGYADAVDQTVTALRSLQAAMSGQQREPMLLSDLSVALECGGSDATSAICANPAIGRFVDRLIDAGGTAIVSETAEFLGAEAIVRNQSATPEVAEQILACIARLEARMQQDGDDYRGVNPTAENIDAGLTTLVEKAMGAVCKIGNGSMKGCLAFGEQPPVPGLYFMDTPFFSPTSITAMVSAGCQLTLFAMGVFNPSGVPLAPTIKICGNRQTLAVWKDAIDVDVSDVLDGAKDLEHAAMTVAVSIAACVAGGLTATERLGEGQIIVARESAAL